MTLVTDTDSKPFLLFLFWWGGGGGIDFRSGSGAVECVERNGMEMGDGNIRWNSVRLG